MRIKKPILRENLQRIAENVKQAKQYISSGKIEVDTLKKIIDIDPTPTKKFVGWMAKRYIEEPIDFDVLKSTIEEFNTFLKKGKSPVKDIYQIKTFKELEDIVQKLNDTGDGLSLKDLESDYDMVLDNKDLLIASPHTHEASRKLGLTKFAYRGDCTDSAWCTTYKSPNHFNDYYYSYNVTFYYIKVKSQRLMDKLIAEFGKEAKSLVVVALAVLEDGKIDGYDGNDRQMGDDKVKKYTEIIGIS